MEPDLSWKWSLAAKLTGAGQADPRAAASAARVSVLAAARGPATRTPRPTGPLSRWPQITPPGVMPGWCARRPRTAASMVPALPSGSR